MNWKDIASIVGKGAPLLGTLLGGPAGAAVGGLIASALGSPAEPEAVAQVLTTHPEAMVKLREVEANRQVQLQQLVEQTAMVEINAARDVVAAVNTTMQVEAKSEKWPTYSWRPFNGFLFGTTVFGCYFVLPLAHITPPTIPTEVWLAWGAILGVASWFRGRMQSGPPAGP